MMSKTEGKDPVENAVEDCCEEMARAILDTCSTQHKHDRYEADVGIQLSFSSSGSESFANVTPESAQVADAHTGMLPLHLAAQKRTTDLRQIEQLLKAYPEGAEQLDSAGNLPLHYACATRPMAAPAIRLLVQAYPSGCMVASGELGLLPLELVAATNPVSLELAPHSPAPVQQAFYEERASTVSALREQLSMDLGKHVISKLQFSYPEVFLQRNKHGQLPLHQFLADDWNRTLVGRNSRDPLEMLKTLLCTYPDAIHMPDGEGRRPIHLVMQQWSRPSLYDMGEIVDFLLQKDPRGAHHADKNGNLPLHNALQNRQCDTKALNQLMQSFPAAMFITNSLGYMPLVYALMTNHCKDVLETVFQVLSADTIPDGIAPLQMILGHRDVSRITWRMVRRGSWKVLLEQCPFLLSRPDEEGRLPLHVVARRDVSEEVVQSLMDQFPAALQTPDGNGCLPLHLAIQQEASAQVVQCLKQAYPQAVQIPIISTGCLPLHLVCICRSNDGRRRRALSAKQRKQIVSCLVNTYPQAARVTCNRGKLPLHYACCSNMSPRQGLRAIVSCYPEGLGQQDHAGNLPLFYACAHEDVPLERILFLVERTPGLFHGFARGV